MADLAIAVGNVGIASAAVQTSKDVFGATIARGIAVYRDAAASEKLKAGDANTAATADVVGITLTGGVLDGICMIVTKGVMEFGATTPAMVAGEMYYLSPTGGGLLCPWADVLTNDVVVEMGRALTATTFDVDINNTGVTKA